MYSLCPGNGGEVFKASPWDCYRNSPDYFNSCATTWAFQTPKNYFGYQKAAQGNSYCGFIAYFNGGFDREIIGVQLTNSLVISQKYYISFKINRADSNFLTGYSVNKIGIRMATIKPSSVTINNSAQFFTNNIISDTLNWTKIFGSFVADSAYKHLMVGNFFDDGNTTIVNDGNGPYSYYFIDDVCLSTDSVFSQNYNTGIKENINEDSFTVFPNPSDKFINLKGGLTLPATILNSQGEIIDSINDIKNADLIDCSAWPNGMYFLITKIKTITLL